MNGNINRFYKYIYIYLERETRERDAIEMKIWFYFSK